MENSGKISKLKLPVKREYLNRDACLAKAREILGQGLISRMNEKQLASEIYFHAVIYYRFSEKNKTKIIRKPGVFRASFAQWAVRHADPINIRDGGDRILRRIIYSACWAIRYR
jgi:hypothetical protein